MCALYSAFQIDDKKVNVENTFDNYPANNCQFSHAIYFRYRSSPTILQGIQYISQTHDHLLARHNHFLVALDLGNQ